MTFHLVSTQLFALPQLPGRYCATQVFRHHASANGAIVQPYMLLGTLPVFCRTVKQSNICSYILDHIRAVHQAVVGSGVLTWNSWPYEVLYLKKKKKKKIHTCFVLHQGVKPVRQLLWQSGVELLLKNCGIAACSKFVNNIKVINKDNVISVLGYCLDIYGYLSV